jgi:hypothetical protein
VTGAALAVALLVGCTADGADEGGDPGDGDDPTATDPADGDAAADSPVTSGDFAEDYLAAADRYADALAQVQDDGAAEVAADPVGASQVYADLEAVTAAVHEEVAALDPPDAAVEAVDGLLDNLAAQLASLDGVVAASEERDDRAMQRHLEDYADRLAVWRDRHDDLVASFDAA